MNDELNPRTKILIAVAAVAGVALLSWMIFAFFGQDDAVSARGFNVDDAGSSPVRSGRPRAEAASGLGPTAAAVPVKSAPAPNPAPANQGIQWVPIPGGTFTMGDAGNSSPRHRVRVGSFEMAKTLVTNWQYKKCVSAGACAAATSLGPDFDGDDHPVVGVDWDQATAFSKWAGGRLPTEAEWEYAARSGGKDQNYPWGNETATCALAVIRGCGGATAPVCSKPAGNTQQGLCDMAGNVLEWTRDSWHNSYAGAPSDGSAWEARPDRATRVMRGGAWRYGGPDTVRSSWRGDYMPGNRDVQAGFRSVRDRN